MKKIVDAALVMALLLASVPGSLEEAAEASPAQRSASARPEQSVSWEDVLP